MEQQTKIFISYARKVDEAFAKKTLFKYLPHPKLNKTLRNSL